MSKQLLHINGIPLSIYKIPIRYEYGFTPEPPPVGDLILVFYTDASTNTFDPVIIVT